jgi:dihydroneopterin aldolase
MNQVRKSDTIFLNGLEVECIIGFIDWERRIKQRVVIDFELPVDCARAAVHDAVEDTLDYKLVSKRIIAFVEASQFKLVETMAERLARLVLDEFAVDWIRLRINKPGAIRGSRDVGVSIERHRESGAQSAPR